jgi:hypothetical protein
MIDTVGTWRVASVTDGGPGRKMDAPKVKMRGENRDE